MLGEPLGLDSEEGGESPNALCHQCLIGRPPPLQGGDHQVLGGVLGRDKFEDFRVVTGPLEQRRAQGVRDKLGLALTQDAMLEGASQHRRRAQLRTQLFVATGRDQDQGRAALNSFCDRVVAGGVARVQRHEDIGAVEGRAFNRARLEAQSVETVFGGDAVAQFDQFGPRFDPLDIQSSNACASQAVIGREGEIALATAHIHQGQGLRRDELRFAEQESQEFDELVYLPKFCLASFGDPAFGRGHAEGVEPRSVAWVDPAFPDAVMGGVRRKVVDCLARNQARFLVVAKFELDRSRRGEQVRRKKVRAQQGRDSLETLFSGEVLRDVARAVPEDK